MPHSRSISQAIPTFHIVARRCDRNVQLRLILGRVHVLSIVLTLVRLGSRPVLTGSSLDA